MNFRLFVACILLVAPAVFASDATRDWEQNFESGKLETSVGGGVYFAPFVATHERPQQKYAGGFVQIGYMLNDLGNGSPWLGNFQFVGEVFGNGIFEGPGDYMAGGLLWLRYNLVPPKSNLVPYVQVGAGLLAADSDGRILGQDFNFSLDAAVGTRCFLTSKWSLNLEYRYQHISNANLADRNIGINAQAAILSVSRFF